MSNPFRYFNSSAEIIRQTAMMYTSYRLSLRRVADLLFERGIDICNETVRFSRKRLGPIFAADRNTVLVVFSFLASILWAPAAIGGSGDRLIFVTSNGWHSGIVIARSDVLLASIPEAADFPNAVYLEFGWGDAEYYPSPRPSFGLALRAALPGPAVMHLSGLSDHPAKVFPTASVLAVPLPDSGLRQLIAHIATSFDRAGDSRAKPGAPGLYSFSRFYPATGKFHLFNTCNTWTARALAAAGIAVESDGVQTADDLMKQVLPFAQRD